MPDPCAVWALRPAELAPAFAGAAESLFAALQRPWRWQGGRPGLGKRAAAHVEALGAALPVVVERRRSSDGSHKLVLEWPERRDRVEVVHMPRAVRGGRVTLCVSSQVGCALGCGFCATATLGLRRHLSAGEIVAQVLVTLAELGPRDPGALTLVFMGMGEPLHNFTNVTRAIGVLTETQGLGLSPRRITVSTAGLVPQIEALGQLERRPLLAVSLNATTNALRSELMPINRRYPLESLLGALERYPLRPREHVTLEYVLLAGVNDTPEDAARLAEIGAGFAHQLNLIPFNAHPGSAFRAPSEAALDDFSRELLRRRARVVTVRRSRGSDIAGACGQLVAAPSGTAPLVELRV
ncbi:MAG TPA: 23S rRNA (adenine(2503)-C(2))-methyltransferase RlmN [Polyangiaceae bacterium]|jgi:23S rRNA (adenine2503-C2)-methyltransferase|nr:23S rRNA (adenine(2503)-C(2))-methyltransferase RlmN [Polyangiaceae bacterium]